MQPNEAIEQPVSLVDERRQLGPCPLGDVVAVDHHDDVPEPHEMPRGLVGVVTHTTGQWLRTAACASGDGCGGHG